MRGEARVPASSASDGRIPAAAQGGGDAPVERRGLPTFQALRYPNFRLFWGSLIVSSVGTWMQIVAQALLTLKLSHGSPLALGLVSLAQALAFFCFAFIGGSVADRVDKRRFLLVTQTIQLGLAALLGVLTATGVIQVWMIVALAFCSGAVLSFDQPARSALVPSLVPREDLLNALALQSVVFTGAALFGPGLAALALKPFGYAGDFFINAASYLAVLVALVALRTGERQEARESRGNVFSNVVEALGQVRRDEALPWVVANYAALFFFGPSNTLILPIFATRVLHVGTNELGLLFMASGGGTIVGALILSSLGNVRRKVALVFGATLVWTAALIFFAFNTSYVFALLALLVFGAAQNICAASTITLMQTRVPARMRGRVMSLNTLLMMGVRPLGDFPVAALLGVFAPAVVVAASAGVVGIYSLSVTLGRPKLRDIV